MFQTFTGNSRRPRQVNLSGRSNTNPWGASSTAGGHNALLNAQQEREKRQRERQKLNSAQVIQNHWRGYKSRQKSNVEWRSRFDAAEANGGTFDSVSNPLPYPSEEAALSQLRLFLRFSDKHNEVDILRLAAFVDRRHQDNLNRQPSNDGPWPYAYIRLQKVIISMLEFRMKAGGERDCKNLLKCLAWVIQQIPEETSRQSPQLYGILGQYLDYSRLRDSDEIRDFLTSLLKPLQTGMPSTPFAYEAFSCKFLTLINLARRAYTLPWLKTISDEINYKLMARTLWGTLDSSDYHGYAEMQEAKSRAILLGFMIYFHRQAVQGQNSYSYSTDKDYLHVVSTLISSLHSTINLENDDEEEDEADIESGLGFEYLVRDIEFVKDEISSLVSKSNISLILGSGQSGESSITAFSQRDESAKQLANFSLTLLKFFPQRADDIRVCLYLGSGIDPTNPNMSIPALKYFWQSAHATRIFGLILRETDSAVPLLKLRSPFGQNDETLQVENHSLRLESVQSEWRVLLIFFELYLFALKLMDDEEFFSPRSITKPANRVENWASMNALPLEDVALFTLFLKNLGFSLYFHAASISSVEKERDRTTGSLSGYFNVSSPSTNKSTLPEKFVETYVAGLNGISLDYVKGLVTGLLRAIYERDSRRPFLPKDHWLMTSRFDMESFIPAVVKEEESRHIIEEEEEPAQDPTADMNLRDYLITSSGHANRIRTSEQLRQQQRKLARQRQLQTVAPRLEILQNMPFFIPFETRVQIFREFIARDKFNRRGGEDVDGWRMTAGRMWTPQEAGRHHARVRREHIFEDAFLQFNHLGSGLKEPIQITFVDSFGQDEAGIDGGGVTKEFLTSITNEAFKPTTQPPMFVENNQNLLYPNPSSLDELKWTITEKLGMNLASSRANEAVKSFLNRYEFLGRVIGKCLYEGILVDVSFAGFFLLKWALTGGNGQAPRESGYRANLNDLRELDEDLYNGLLQLKNDPGDVSAYSLDFTIADTITTDYEHEKTKSFIRQLKPDGANIAVTNENRLVYISCVARHRLQLQPHKQTMAFLQGLASIIQPSWLSMFNQHELQTLIGGASSAIDVSDLRENTVYGGLYVIGDDGEEHPTVNLFWKVMQSLDDSQRRAVLKFVTSTPRAPLLGFGSLNPKFSIRDGGTDETRLPSTSTCVNLLKLPRYSNEKVLREKLLTAINSGAGFDLS